MVRAWSAIERVIAWRIHHVAYVENLKPLVWSNLSTARIRPRLPSWIRSSSCIPRPRVALGDAHHEAQVGLGQLALGPLAARRRCAAGGAARPRRLDADVDAPPPPWWPSSMSCARRRSSSAVSRSTWPISRRYMRTPSDVDVSPRGAARVVVQLRRRRLSRRSSSTSSTGERTGRIGVGRRVVGSSTDLVEVDPLVGQRLARRCRAPRRTARRGAARSATSSACTLPWRRPRSVRSAHSLASTPLMRERGRRARWLGASTGRSETSGASGSPI